MFPPPSVLCVWCWLCLTPLMSLPPPFSLSNSHTKVRPSFPRFSHSYWYSWYNRRGEVGWVRVEGWHRSEWDVSLKNIWHQRSLLRWSGISNGPHSPHSQELLLDSFVTPGGNSEVSDHERRRRRKKVPEFSSSFYDVKVWRWTSSQGSGGFRYCLWGLSLQSFHLINQKELWFNPNIHDGIFLFLCLRYILKICWLSG